jgi:hypothetical protein
VKLTAIAILGVLLFVPANWPQQSAPKNLDEKALRTAEDTLAKRLVELRKKANLRPLIRIKRRVELVQLACTAAIQGKPSPLIFVSNIHHLTSYRTDATESDRTLEKVALFDAKFPDSSSLQRFSIAVWPPKGADSRSGVYWVSVGLFVSGGSEFFENHFTDGAFYKNDWKEYVSPECRDVK